MTRSWPGWYCPRCGANGDPLTDPWAAELPLEFQRRHSERELAECFEEPEATPSGAGDG